MNIETILKQAKHESDPQKQLSLLADFIGQHLDELDNRQFIALLQPCVTAAQTSMEAKHDFDSMSEYVFAICKLAEYYIRDEQTWRATPLLAEAYQMTVEAEAADDWKNETLLTIADLQDSNGRRKLSQDIRAEAAKYGSAGEEPSHYLKYDPVEDSESYLAIKDDMEHDLYEMTKDDERPMGYCFRYWSLKQELLKKKYGIDWRTPRQMNPRVMFD